MTLFHWICLGAFLVCSAACLYHFIRTLAAGMPPDFARRHGRVGAAIVYSFTGAMSPLKKETAYLHLPTYAAGLMFHLGTFLSLTILVLLFAGLHIPGRPAYILAVLLAVSGAAGLSVLLKRIVKAPLRHLSHADDYISNVLVTLFHFLTAVTLLKAILLPVLLLYGSILFLYIPVGKLRHTVYFFTSRIHLGVFNGRRGVWPVRKGGYNDGNV
jgi:hypothetical protein